MDLVVENLTPSGRYIFPNVISIEAHNFVKFSPYGAITDKHNHEFNLTFGQMQADIRDVTFYLKETGIPNISDGGLADVVFGKEGI